MENEKNLSNKASEMEKALKLEDAINELGQISMQICSISNILHFLRDFWLKKTRSIDDETSVLVVCMWQLDYIYNRFDSLLDTFADCSSRS